MGYVLRERKREEDGQVICCWLIAESLQELEEAAVHVTRFKCQEPSVTIPYELPFVDGPTKNPDFHQPLSLTQKYLYQEHCKD